jgi:DNA-binding protein YbaB
MDASPGVNAALRARLDELLGDYDELRKGLARAQDKMRTMRATAASTDHTVAVTVDSRGWLAELRIEPRAYRRFSPSQLAGEIQRLAAEACATVTGDMAEVMTPFLPGGISYQDVISGDADPASVTPTLLTNETYDEWRARFRNPPDAPAAR